MKSTALLRKEARSRRQSRIRKVITGTNTKPRLCIYRSLRYVYAQLISDDNGCTLVSCSSKEFAETSSSVSSKESAKQVGLKLAQLALEKDIKDVVFDRNGYLYHGRVAAIAEGAREGGLNF